MNLFTEICTATEKLCKSGAPNGENFRCAWCAYKFEPGDKYTNSGKEEDRYISGNPLVCLNCFNTYDNLKEELQKRYHEFMSERLWWFRNESKY